MTLMIGIPPPPDDVRGPIPRLDTLWKVERIIRDANDEGEGPLTLREIARRLEEKGVGPATVRVCVDELARRGLVTATARGVAWTYVSPEARALIRRKKWIPLR